MQCNCMSQVSSACPVRKRKQPLLTCMSGLIKKHFLILLASMVRDYDGKHIGSPCEIVFLKLAKVAAWLLQVSQQ